jgi:hypothetical protein
MSETPPNVVPNDIVELKRLKRQKRLKRKERKQRKLEVLASEQPTPEQPEQWTDFSAETEGKETVVNKNQEAKRQPKKHKAHYALAALAFALAAIGLILNATYSYTRATDDLDKAIMCALGLTAEAILFFVPSVMAGLWRQRKVGAFLTACLVYPLLFCFAILNSIGWASQNLHDATTVRAERVSPQIDDALRRIAVLEASRADECKRRGDNCRRLEKEEANARDVLSQARTQQATNADPQLNAARNLISWASAGYVQPRPEDFPNLRIFCLTLIPQIGGLILMMARRD